MTELEFIQAVDFLDSQWWASEISNLDYGKTYRGLVDAYLKDHDVLPLGYLR